MIARRPLTIITAVGRTEPARFQFDLRASIESLAALRAPAPVYWMQSLDGDGTIASHTARYTTTIVLPPVSEQHIGAANTRNRALAFAPAGWIASVDSDDRIVPVTFGAMLADAESANTRWSAGRIDDIDEDGEVVRNGPDLIGERDIPLAGFTNYHDAYGVLPWHASAMIYDAELARSIGGWVDDSRLTHSEDTAFVARLSASSVGRWFPHAVLHYRKHSSSVTAQSDWIRTDAELESVKDYAHRRLAGRS